MPCCRRRVRFEPCADNSVSQESAWQSAGCACMSLDLLRAPTVREAARSEAGANTQARPGQEGSCPTSAPAAPWPRGMSAFELGSRGSRWLTVWRPPPIATDASLDAPFVGVRQPLLLRPSPPACGPLASRCRDAQSARRCGRVPPRHRQRPGSRLSTRSGHFIGGSERSVSASSFERPS